MSTVKESEKVPIESTTTVTSAIVSDTSPLENGRKNSTNDDNNNQSNGSFKSNGDSDHSKGNHLIDKSNHFISNNADELKKKFAKYSGGAIRLTKDDENGIALIKIDNPNRRNALSGSMMIDLYNIVGELENWDRGKGIILYGADGFFSSGGDMNTVKEIDNHDDGRDMGILMYDTLQRFQALPMISVSLIEGKAIGGGAELTTACDFRLMSKSAKIGFVHIKLGITVSWGAGTRLVHIIGSHKALEIISSGRQLTASEALEIGLATHIIDDSSPSSSEPKKTNLDYAKEWLCDHTDGPTETIQCLKTIIHSARTLPFRESLKRELETFPKVWGSPPHKKALSMNIKLR